MRNAILSEAQVEALLVLYDAGVVDEAHAKSLPELGLEDGRARALVRRLKHFAMVCNVQLGSYSGPYVYWLSALGIERAQAEKAQAA
ncbi:MAG: hypothetical protein ACREH4_01365 [Vitreimonas sp.]